jgi:1,4-dihydroxy-2-naphthoyl-CoA hydrolase
MFNPAVTIEMLNEKFNINMTKFLGIEYTELGINFLAGKMPVDERTQQPFGVLHGGASVVFAESLGSLASNLIVDQQNQYCVGLDINANHIKGMKEGFVYGKATAVHIGKRTHIWQINITNDKQDLVCTSRLTIAVIDKK